MLMKSVFTVCGRMCERVFASKFFSPKVRGYIKEEIKTVMFFLWDCSRGGKLSTGRLRCVQKSYSELYFP